MGEDYALIADRPGWVLVMDGVAHSWLDPEDPTRLEFGYMQRMADFIDQIEPTGERIRAVHIGGAAMTMPRYLAAKRPTSPQIVLEPNVGLTEMVRRELPLPPHSGIKVRAQDGRSGLAEMPDDYARVLIVDAFADARVPADLVSAEFFAETFRVLSADGLLLMNLIDIHPLSWTRRVLAGVREQFGELALCGESATLKGRRHGNLLIAAANTELPMDAVQRRAAGSAFPYRVIGNEGLVRFIGHAPPFTDADAEASPEVQRGLLHFD